MMDFLAQLLVARIWPAGHQSRSPEDPRSHAAELHPDGNPDGRARAPRLVDGAYSTRNLELRLWPRERRHGQRVTLERTPARAGVIGFVYEKINDHEYVEPNRDTESSYFRLIRQLRRLILADPRSAPDRVRRSDRNCMIILPFMQKQLPEPVRDRQRWGQAVEAWQKSGIRSRTSSRWATVRTSSVFSQVLGDIFPRRPTCAEIEQQSRTPP